MFHEAKSLLKTSIVEIISRDEFRIPLSFEGDSWLSILFSEENRTQNLLLRNNQSVVVLAFCYFCIQLYLRLDQKTKAISDRRA